MDLKGLMFSICFTSLLPLNAQETESRSDTIPYRIAFSDKITFRVGVQNAANRFVLSAEDGTSVRYRPVNRNIVKISTQFRALDISFGLTPAILNPERDRENARIRNMNFRVFLGRWMQTFDYYDQRGHFGEFDGDEVYLPDLESRKIGGTTAYVFNRNFSFRALISQNEWQRRSAGSFVPRFVAYYTRYKLVLEDSVLRSHSYDLGLGPGYHYNWVLHPNIMVSAGNTTGIGINFLEDDGNTTTTSFLWETIFRGGISYNSNRFFGGVDLSYAFLEHSRSREVRVDDRIYFAQVYIGYRIQAPRKLIEAAEKVNRKFGLN
ncbi:MAG: DUF4421 family protein [Robiginitalea sp.]|uniref:DUF4421 family protein n=1 Tax=Robiginitalea sp. TaxID=1902411 RepID=UPI003C71BB5E